MGCEDEVNHIVLIISQLPDILQKCFCTLDRPSNTTKTAVKQTTHTLNLFQSKACVTLKILWQYIINSSESVLQKTFSVFLGNVTNLVLLETLQTLLKIEYRNVTLDKE